MYRRSRIAGRATTAVTTALALLATSAVTVAPAAFAQTVPATTLTAADEPGEKFSAKVLDQLEDKKTADFWIRFADKADLAPAKDIADWAERGQYVYDALTSHGEGVPGRRGRASSRRPAPTTRPTGSATRSSSRTGHWQLAERVAPAARSRQVHERIAVQPEEPVERKPSDREGAPPPSSGAWTRSTRPTCGTMGYTGDGITVANIDTGVDVEHPALPEQYRGSTRAATVEQRLQLVRHQRLLRRGAPCDIDAHGTHTMGTMVGDDGEGNQIGVAPDADWIAANGCDNPAADEDLLASGAVDPRADPHRRQRPRPGQAPARREQLLGHPGGPGPAIEDWMSAETAAWEAAGIFGAWAGGNGGPAASRRRSPASSSTPTRSARSASTAPSRRSRRAARAQTARPSRTSPLPA